MPFTLLMREARIIWTRLSPPSYPLTPRMQGCTPLTHLGGAYMHTL